MFIGREKELNKLYYFDRFEIADIYGCRLVGKTALNSEFTKDKDNVFYTGVKTKIKQNLDNFSKLIMEYNMANVVDSSFASFPSVLGYIFELAKTKRIVQMDDHLSLEDNFK